jgi:hypothetical protein
MRAKDKILRKVKLRASRMENLKVEIAQRKTDTRGYVLKMLEELDFNLTPFRNLDNNIVFRDFCVNSIQQRIRLLDSGASIDVSWADDETQMQPNGILVKWSQDYQTANSCEPELYVDVAAALFK